jgi:hypothetical protein
VRASTSSVRRYSLRPKKMVFISGRRHVHASLSTPGCAPSHFFVPVICMNTDKYLYINFIDNIKQAWKQKLMYTHTRGSEMTWWVFVAASSCKFNRFSFFLSVSPELCSYVYWDVWIPWQKMWCGKKLQREKVCVRACAVARVCVLACECRFSHLKPFVLQEPSPMEWFVHEICTW